MPKKIVVFCDGTWNSPKTDHPTHVERLHKVTEKAFKNDPDLLCEYFPGVGAGTRFSTFTGQTLDKIGGGAFGLGLNENIREAYEFIAREYEPGDQLYLFGFSRGAFTVRSLAGLIRKAGIPDKVSGETVKAAMALYRKRGEENHPDAPHIQKARQRLSPQFATSKEDMKFRGDKSYLIDIAYLGVWDTVGAMGVPNLLGSFSEWWNQRHAFHDMDLSSSVRAARHAMALDERRYFFQPALWDNLAKLNGKMAEHDPDRPYQQIWFAGDHGMVGGSGANQSLTSHTMDWIVEGAIKAELDIDPTKIMTHVARDPLDRDPLTIKTKLVYRLNKNKLYRWRKGPAYQAHHNLSASATTLFEKDDGYRPKSLSRLFLNFLVA